MFMKLADIKTRADANPDTRTATGAETGATGGIQSNQDIMLSPISPIEGQAV